MNSLITQALDVVVKQGQCLLCEVKLISKAVAESHLTSKRHLNNVEFFKKSLKKNIEEKNVPALQRELGRDNAEDLFCKMCDLMFPNAKAVEEHLSTEDHKNGYMYCYLCEEGMGAKMSKNRHVTQFPHRDLIQLKSKLIKQGIRDEFWLFEANGIQCKICHTGAMPSSDILWSHLKSERHRASFKEWANSVPIKKPLPESESRWYYCDTCGRDMDGTSEAEKHYAGDVHSKNIATYCRVCDIHASTPELLKLHCKSTQHLENLNKPKKKAGKKVTIENKLSKARKEDEAPITSKSEDLQSTSNCPGKQGRGKIRSELKKVPPDPQGPQNMQENPKGNGNLKDQVFLELEKLVRKLYYSRTVPYDVALRYLQQVNEEVNTLGKTFAQNSALVEHSQDKTESSHEKCYTLYVSDDASNDNNASVEADVENAALSVHQEPFVAEAPVKLIEDYNTVTSVDSITKGARVDEADDNVARVKEESPAAEVINDVTMEDDNIEETDGKNGAAFEEPRDISVLLNDIVQRKLEVERDNPNEHIGEAAVLNEIETLLRQVSDGSCPLDETLKCLRNFNDILETENLSEDVGAHCETPPPDDCQIPKFAYSKEVLLAMRTPSTFTYVTPQLKAVLLSNHIWTGQNAMLAAESCQVSVYNYYAGSNFGRFKDFLEVYLQGSVDLVRQQEQDD